MVTIFCVILAFGLLFLLGPLPRLTLGDVNNILHTFVINGTTIYIPDDTTRDIENDIRCQRKLGEEYRQYEPGTNYEVHQLIEELDNAGLSDDYAIKTTYIDENGVEAVDSFFWRFEQVSRDLWFLSVKGKKAEPNFLTDYVMLRTSWNGQSNSQHGSVTGKHMLVAKIAGSAQYMCVDGSAKTTTTQPQALTTVSDVTTPPKSTSPAFTSPTTEFPVTADDPLTTATISSIVTTSTSSSSSFKSTLLTSSWHTTSFTQESNTIFKTTTTPSPLNQSVNPVCPSCKDNDCDCLCYIGPLINLTENEENKLVDKIKADLVVDRKKLSKQTRRLVSAKDERTTSQVAGVFGIVLLVIPFGLMLLSDLLSLLQFVMKK